MKIKLDELCVWRAAEEDIPSLMRVHRDAVSALGGRFYPPEVVERWASAYSYNQYREGMRKGEVYWIASKDFASREVIAFSTHAERDGQHHLDDLYVCAEAGKQGLGKKLLGLVGHFAQSHGATSLHLLSSLPAETFYRAAGFVEIARKEHSILGNVPVMRKDLLKP